MTPGQGGDKRRAMVRITIYIKVELAVSHRTEELVLPKIESVIHAISLSGPKKPSRSLQGLSGGTTSTLALSTIHFSIIFNHLTCP